MLNHNNYFPVEPWFPVPLYINWVSQKNFNGIQQDFQRVVDILKANGTFTYREDWNSHKTSDVTFTKNLFEEHNLTLFQQELDEHIFNYLNLINSPVAKKEENFKYKIFGSWMTLSTKKDYAHIHTHGSSDLSGVYYFQTNGNDGSIFFENPSKYLENSYCFSHIDSRASWKPEVGKLLLFPGWLPHGVTTNTTDHERISVSFNIIFERNYG